MKITDASIDGRSVGDRGTNDIADERAKLMGAKLRVAAGTAVLMATPTSWRHNRCRLRTAELRNLLRRGSQPSAYPITGVSVLTPLGYEEQ